MRIDLALLLSSDGIVLLQRQGDVWRRLGAAKVAADTLAQDLADLCKIARGAANGPLRTKLILPADQIKFLTLPFSQADLPTVHGALEGATPYPVSDLAVDFQSGQDVTYIAAASHATLTEAEAFADAHGFNPVCFAALPAPDTHRSEVFFGLTSLAANLIGDDTPPERDATAPVLTGTRLLTRGVIENDLEALEAQGRRQTSPMKLPQTHHHPSDPIPPEVYPAHITKVGAQIDLVVAEVWNTSPAAHSIPAPRSVAPTKSRRLVAGFALAIAASLALLWIAPSDADDPLPAPATTQQIAETPVPDTPSEAPLSAPPSTRPVLVVQPDLALPQPEPSPPTYTAREGSGPNPSDRLQMATGLGPLIDTPTFDQVIAFYRAKGVWLDGARLPMSPSGVILRGRSPAVIDRAVVAQAPTGLGPIDPDSPETDFQSPANPPPAGTEFDVDANGFVIATQDGALTPEGALVIAGLPDLPVQPRPDGLAPEPTADAPTAGAVGLSALELQGNGTVALDPVIVEDGADADLRPQLRPNGLAPATASADPDVAPDAQGAAEATLRFDNSTVQAVATSLRPVARPDGLASAASAAQPTATAAVIDVPQNTEPLPGGVARAATTERGLRLGQINLIGVYGRPDARRALVRMRNGRTEQVNVGSRLDGGEVVAIGDTILNYVKRGQTYVLSLPEG